MSSGDLKRAKRRVRRHVLAERDTLSSDRRAAMGERIAERFLALPEVQAARTVMLYWSFGSEVPTAGLIERVHERGAGVALPRIEGSELVPVRFEPGDPTRATSFGAREPVDGPTIAAAMLDVIAVPGVAFDRDGRRVGYGAGYYDRLLPGTRGAAVAVAFDLQVLDEELPAGRADVQVDVIVTESETIRTAAT